MINDFNIPVDIGRIVNICCASATLHKIYSSRNFSHNGRQDMYDVGTLEWKNLWIVKCNRRLIHTVYGHRFTHSSILRKMAIWKKMFGSLEIVIFQQYNFENFFFKFYL